MGIKLQVRRGMKQELPQLSPGEFGLCLDTMELFIGTMTGNLPVVLEDGAGDMLKAVYDPNNQELPLLPETGDGSNVTASFTEAEQDADIVSGEKLSVLFGKIKKRFSTYDTNGDGVVDKAASVPWDGVTSKPSTFTPSAHNHDDRYYTETETDTKLAGKANSSHTHGVADISGVLPATKGGTGANKSVLAISSAIVTTESQGYANVNISTNATICAVVSQGSATGQCYSISVIDPKTGGFSIQVKDYNGNVVANKTLRVNYIAYSI